jgi:hypothetical protein
VQIVPHEENLYKALRASPVAPATAPAGCPALPRIAPPQHGAASQRRIEKAGHNGRALESLGKPSFERKPGEISDALAAAYVVMVDRAQRLALGEEDDR